MGGQDAVGGHSARHHALPRGHVERSAAGVVDGGVPEGPVAAEGRLPEVREAPQPLRVPWPVVGKREEVESRDGRAHDLGRRVPLRLGNGDSETARTEASVQAPRRAAASRTPGLAWLRKTAGRAPRRQQQGTPRGTLTEPLARRPHAATCARNAWCIPHNWVDGDQTGRARVPWAHARAVSAARHAPWSSSVGRGRTLEPRRRGSAGETRGEQTSTGMRYTQEGRGSVT